LKFVKIGARRNEALDCRVYAKGALGICGVDLEACKQFIEAEIINVKNNGGTKRKKKKNSRNIHEGIKL
jgi:phage terminase large subunit GpA-like protein